MRFSSSLRRLGRLRRAAGFTLIELMVVLVIIGVLAALVVPNVLDRADDARATAARTDVNNLMQALKLYRLDNQRYPTSEQGLQAQCRFAAIDDSQQLLHLLWQLLAPLPDRLGKADCPVAIAVVLSGLEAAGMHADELFDDPQQRRRRSLNQVLDAVNQRYGNNTLYFGALQAAIAAGAAPMRIPFQAIPDLATQGEARPRLRQHTAGQARARPRHRLDG